jgi:penicillin-binding protein 1C
MRHLLRPTRKTLTIAAAVVLLGSVALGVATLNALRPLPDELAHLNGQIRKQQFLDRHGRPLNRTYENRWNLYDTVSLHEVPVFLQQAFVVSEDKRFYTNTGADWRARLSALQQNIRAGKAVRGASTISEQVVRMIHQRPRTVWSRWLEGFEAAQLEARNTKADILEFYLNQVPYESQRRGIKQAAAYYFDRDLSTLSRKEMLALVVLIRAPRWFDPARYPDKLDKAIARLGKRMIEHGVLSHAQFAALQKEPLEVHRSALAINAAHYIRYVRNHVLAEEEMPGLEKVQTTLDADLQQRVQRALDTRLDAMGPHNVSNGAVLIVDHRRNEVIAWVVGQAGKDHRRFNALDPIVTPRQPGSALKPFVYALALKKGWTAATLVDDSPLEEGVGAGMHAYHNYSHNHYGPIAVRKALGNSLNIPAVRAIQFVGPEALLNLLHATGMHSLSDHPNVYGDGIALGDGEVSLFELVQAYTTLARMGDYKPLSLIRDPARRHDGHRVLNEDIASLVADILSDPGAREEEFGRNSILNLPYPTAVKTGTSSDYRDAWTVGFNDRYTVGVWMGNMDYRPMHEVTGSRGPALVLRTVFNELNRGRELRPLYHSPHLEKRRVCIDTGLLAADQCQARDEWFLPGRYAAPPQAPSPSAPIRIQKPTPNLHMAMDPRIPDDQEVFQFELNHRDKLKRVEWYINGKRVASGDDYRYRWALRKGHFRTFARVWLGDAAAPVTTAAVDYLVK